MTFPRLGDQFYPLSTGSTQCVHTVHCPVCPLSSVSSVSRNIHPVCVRLIKRKIVPFSTSIVMGNQLRFILNVSSFLFDNLPRTAQCSTMILLFGSVKGPIACKTCRDFKILKFEKMVWFQIGNLFFKSFD